jgi:ribosomal protein L35
MASRRHLLRERRHAARRARAIHRAVSSVDSKAVRDELLSMIDR